MTVGGTSANQRNVISGNGLGGITVDAVAFDSTVTLEIYNNYIGTNAAGTGDLGNSRVGIDIDNGSATIGGSSANQRNVISGNDGGGITVDTEATVEIYNNYIGTNAAGTGDLGNADFGINIGDGSAIISRRNVISGNDGSGIGVATEGTVEIYSNYIGTNATGTSDLGNSDNGIIVFNANVIIGGTGVEGAGLPVSLGNVISGNNANGIRLVANVTGYVTTVQRNLIGTNASGLGDLGNSQNGILIERNAPLTVEHLIGSSTNSLNGNVISGNSGDVLAGNGIKINENISGVKIFGNKIGTNINGTAALPNAGDGIEIASGSNQVGLANNNAARNIIAGNFGNGILLSGPGATLNSIQNNFIGTNSIGANLGNLIEGVLVTSSATSNTIGGTTVGAGNTIAFNSSDGVHVSSTTATGNAIQRNAIHSNSGLGINLGGVGVAANDLNDADTGPNNLQNYPVLQMASPTQISGTLNSTSGAFTIDFYRVDVCNQNNHGEGRHYLGSTNVTTVGNNAAFSAAHSGLTVGQIVTATATDAEGNTSEFSQCLTVRSALQFSSANYTANENGGSVVITVNRVGGTDAGMTVDYATGDGTATVGEDYSASSGTLIFATNETSKTFVVPILDDGVFEVNETVNLSLGNVTGVGAVLGTPSTAVLTIVDNEPQPTISVNDVAITEGNSGTKNFAFTVSLSGSSSQTVSVTYATADGTATAGSDYQATGATLTYTAGQTSKTINVTVSGDPVGEPDENFFVNLTNPTNASIADGQGLGTILNDDTCINSINPTVVNAAAVGGTGSVSVTSGCAWTAVSNDNWITVTSGSPGSGNGTIGYSVTTNTSAARVGTITIAGQTFTVNQDGTAPTPTPSPTPVSLTTSPGTNVNVQGNGVSVTFSGVTTGGTTTIASIDPNLIGTVPSGYAIFGSSVAFQITTTAGITPPIDLCFNVSTVNDPVAFANLRVLHNENGLLVDRTLSHDFPTRTVCARTTTLSPFLVAQATQNPIDGTDLFVTQHYRDFLSREPDPAGLQFWSNEIDVCGTDLPCREVKRINTSAAYFLSIEFQETGFLVYRFFKTAYGDSTSPGVSGTVPVIRRQEFQPDTERISQGVQVGIGDWQQHLESNKQAYALEFVQRQRFLDAFPLSLTPTQFVEGLNTKAGGVLSAAEADQLIAQLTANNTAAGRASAVRRVAEDSDLRQAELNRAFVLMQYYGYLRRNPDDGLDANFGGWKFWLDKLNQFNGNFIQAEMVKAFISSIEYRERFFVQP